MFDIFILIIDATIRVSIPLIFLALAGLFSERSGVVNIALEGKLLSTAFIAASVSYYTNSHCLALCSAIVVGVLIALLHGLAVITYRGDQIVSGTAINMLAAGMTVTLGRYWFQMGGQTPALMNEQRFLALHLPFEELIGQIPFIGKIYVDLISSQNFLVYLAFFCVLFSYLILYKTRFGLRLRAVGENPFAVDTAGISVAFLRYRALIISGILAGCAGAYLSTAHAAGFVPGMSAGKGFIALAALIFGKWQPVRVLFSCLLFGLLDSIAVRLQGLSFSILGKIPVQFIEMLPYILTVLLLAGFLGKSIAPKYIGQPYIKSR